MMMAMSGGGYNDDDDDDYRDKEIENKSMFAKLRIYVQVLDGKTTLLGPGRGGARGTQGIGTWSLAQTLARIMQS
jgi:hypothetical protein